jgi:hypothetical protein
MAALLSLSSGFLFVRLSRLPYIKPEVFEAFAL